MSDDLCHQNLNSQDLTVLLAANDRLQNSTARTEEQAELIETLMRLPAIGLKLQISPSLLKKMERNTKSKSSNERETSHEASTSKVQATTPDNSKASVLGAVMLQIGSWQLVARNEGDLVAKFYYAKKKLVWEILRNGLKEKMEINWSDIIGITATMEENKPGVLEIELQHSPKFYKEIEPEPRKHTKWTNGSDFTDGQAYINRRHFAVFPPRMLEKHYLKLLRHDTHLSELSQRPFPTFNFPYFPSVFLNPYAIPFEENRFKIPQSFPQCQTQYYEYHQEMELFNQGTKNQVNLMRSTYEHEANYYQGNLMIPSEEVSEGWMMSSNDPMQNEYAYIAANPMSSSIYYADQEQNIAINMAYESDSSVHTQHLNGMGVRFR